MPIATNWITKILRKLIPAFSGSKIIVYASGNRGARPLLLLQINLMKKL